MPRRNPRIREDELLLAGVSEAAGRERIGRRHATYPGSPHRSCPVVMRALVLFVKLSERFTAKTRENARLDLYEHGLTIAVNGRIHVVRYDSTSVFQQDAEYPHDRGTTRPCTVTDVGGQQVVLCGRPPRGLPETTACGGFHDAREWGAEIQRAVTEAQLPGALAALDEGERLAFGDIWLTREKIGAGQVAARWPLVERIEIQNGSVGLSIAGSWHSLGTVVSEVPNFFVLRALVELLRTDGSRQL